MWRRLGSKVTVVEFLGRITPKGPIPEVDHLLFQSGKPAARRLSKNARLLFLRSMHRHLTGLLVQHFHSSARLSVLLL